MVFVSQQLKAEPDLSALLVDQVSQIARTDPGKTAFTFFDYSSDRAGHPTATTYGELDLRARAIAGELLEITSAGARAAVLCPQDGHYITAFLGCLYAGIIAVPLYAPESHRSSERLALAMADCRPDVVITTWPFAVNAEELAGLPQLDEARPKELLLIDLVDTARGHSVRPARTGPSDIAYLQYTSGSTRSPAGVEVRFGNVAANVEQLRGCLGIDESSHLVSWLPFFHDMGLVFTVLLPLTLGVSVDYLTPFAFIQQPRRWMRLLSERRATHAASPNFGLDMCVDRLDESKRAGLDLTALRVLANASEPVRAVTLQRFSEAFGPYGFDPASHTPAYGLAEATLLVSAAASRLAPAVGVLDRPALGEHKIEWLPPGEEGYLAVGCGAPHDQEVFIADLETGLAVPPDGVGEIWVRGPHVCAGYWQQPERSAEVFGARRADEGDDAPWLRTGDLGFLHNGEVFITGRLKDMIIVDGRNQYAADLEITAEEASSAVRRGHVAAFSVDTGDREQLVLVAELANAAVNTADVKQAIRAAVRDLHAVEAQEVVLVRQGSLPKTTSGKLQRGACRDRYLRGELAAG